MKSKLFISLDILVATIITLGSVVCVINFDLLSTIDGHIHLAWGYYWNQQLLAGQIFPKWFEEAFGGLGSASFVFYPPLLKLLSLPFAILNLSPSQQLKGSIILILIFNTIGVLQFSRILFSRNSVHTFLAVSLGTLNPFLFSEIFKRGGFAGACAIAIIPWVMTGIFLALQSSKPLGILPLTVAFAALFASHIPSSICFLFVYICSIALLIILRQINWRRAFWQLITPLIIALLLNAFWVLPVLLDVHLIQKTFEPLPKVIRDRLFFKGTLDLQPILVPSGIEAIISKMFFMELIILLLAIIFLTPWKVQNSINILINLQIFMGVISLLMITDLSYPIYQYISLFRKLQFPWRYLYISSSIIPYITSSILKETQDKSSFFKRKIVGIAIIFFLLSINYKSAGFILRTGNSNLRAIDYLMINNKQIPSRFLDNSKIEKLDEEYYYLLLESKNSLNHIYLNNKKQFFQLDVNDYLPVTVRQNDNWLSLVNLNSKSKYRSKMPEIFLPKPYPIVEFVQGQGDVSIKKWELGKRRFNLTATTDVVLNLKTFYYPGWSLEATSTPPTETQKPLLLAATDGRMQLQLSEGVYDIKIEYRGTVAEQWGKLISLTTFFLLILLFLFCHSPILREY